MATTDAPRPDVFLADALTLGALADAGLLHLLPVEVTAAVPAHFASAEGLWVGLTGRSREVVYDPQRAVPENLPQSLSALGEPRFRATFALAPGDRALVAHLAVYRALNGATALQELLAKLAANQPLLVADDAAVVEAVAAGEAVWGLAGSDALCRHRAEAEAGVPGLATFHMLSGDASGFVGLSAAGVLSDHPRAVALVAHLLTAEAQIRLVEATCSYPLVEGIEPPPGQPPLVDLDAPQIDFGAVAAVREATREALAEGELAR
jgi:iron(III) transport system substrate-binding protein